MHPLTRFIVRCTIAFVLIFITAQLFNRFCLFSYKCHPIYFSKYWPRSEGGESFSIDFEVMNNNSDLQFDALDTRISSVVNRVNTVEFFAKNISKQKIVFRPSLKVEPEIFEKYIKRINCLCSHEYSLAAGQSVKLRMEFFVDPQMVLDATFEDLTGGLNNSAVKISYHIK